MINGKYILIKNVYFIDEKEYIGYGIKYADEETNIVYEDISMNIEMVSWLVEFCNSLVLSPLHLSDVVEDFLVGITYYNEET